MKTATSCLTLVTTTILGCVIVQKSESKTECRNISTIDVTLRDMYCDGNFFTTFMTKTRENLQLDNICFTLFPAKPDTFILYEARVFCNGTKVFSTAIAKSIGPGMYSTSTTNSITLQKVVGCTGCDGTVTYNCCEYGGCHGTFVFGNSFINRPLELSCFKKAQAIVASQNLSQEEIFPLPMKLPNACITNQTCTLPSSCTHCRSPCGN